MLRPDTLALTALLAVLTSLGPLSTDMYLPSLPAIGGALGSSAAEVQLTLSVFLVGFALGQIAYGPLADRYGRKPVLMVGLALFTAASIACVLAWSIEALIAARFVQALGACGPVVIARSIVRDLYAGPRAGQELSRMGSIMGLVPAVAPVLGGLIETAFGWRATFGATVAFGLLASAAVLWGLPETLRQRAPEVPSPASILRVYREIARHGGFRAYLGLVVLGYAGLFAYISGSSFVLQGLYGLGELAFGIAFSVGVIGYITGTLLATRLNPRLGLDTTTGFGAGCLALGGVLMVATVVAGWASPAAIVGPMVVFMLGVGLAFPSSIAGALVPFPHRAGAASSLLGFTQMTFAAIVGIGVGHSLGDSALPLAITIAACGLGALALWAATRKVRRAMAHAHP